MASIFFKRLNDKYGKTGKDNIRGKKYQEMMKEILVHNNEKIGNAIGRLTNENYKNSLGKLSKTKQKVVKLPDISKVIPKRSIFISKGADSGKIISDTLRTRLEKNLRDTLKQFQKSGKNKMEMQRGKSTGKINPELINLFQEKIKQTFLSYTKRDKRTGIPPNIKNIAVTEIRSVVNSIKESYNKKLMEKNPDLQMFKVWKHNKQLSKKPRDTHIAMNDVVIWHDSFFMVGREKGYGVDFMSRPHDPEAPIDQVIGCNCDVIYKAQI